MTQVNRLKDKTKAGNDNVKEENKNKILRKEIKDKTEKIASL